MTMYPIERVPAHVAGERERYWNRVHAPTANHRTPFGGVDRLVWQLIADEQADSPELKTLKAKASYIQSFPKESPTWGSLLLLDFGLTLLGTYKPRCLKICFEL